MFHQDIGRDSAHLMLPMRFGMEHEPNIGVSLWELQDFIVAELCPCGNYLSLSSSLPQVEI